MGTLLSVRSSAQADRLNVKCQDGLLARLAVEGAGITPWEADVLVDTVHQVYFSELNGGVMRSGQVRYECVSETEGAGKPLSQCKLVSVVLTLLDGKNDRLVHLESGAVGLRRHRLRRLCEEARDQGGVLSQEDLAFLLCCDVRTIRRDIWWLRKEKDIRVPTRGLVNDIGPTLSHKAVAIRHWLSGKEPVEAARVIGHSLHAFERYIQAFCRIVYLTRHGFSPSEISMLVGTSLAATEIYLEIYWSHKDRPECQRRFEEIDWIGASFFEDTEKKKEAMSRSRHSRDERRTL